VERTGRAGAAGRHARPTHSDPIDSPPAVAGMVSQALWRIVRLTAGIICIVVGIIGLFLPVIQGIAFLIIGLTILSRDSRHAHAVLVWLKERVGWQEKAVTIESPEGVHHGGREGPVGEQAPRHRTGS